MTGPTTAGQLLELARHQLQELDRRAKTPHAATAEGLAAAWPAFHGATDRLITALRAERQVEVRHDAPARQPASPTPPPGRPDRQLHRAAELISAAADLISTRDRRFLTDQQRAADAAHVGKHLAGGAYLVAATTISRPALLATAQAAVTAAISWRGSLTDGKHAIDTAISLTDASTGPARPGADGPNPAGLARALHDWHSTAVTAAHQPAPTRADLLATAVTAGRLLALSQVVLRAHAETVGPADAVTAVVEQVRRAGVSCNSAAQAWKFTATGLDTISPELRRATTALDSAIGQFARDGSSWTSPDAVRAQAPPEVALDLARGALAAARAVGEHHAAVVTQLGQTGALYAPATRLPVSEERVEAILDRRWVPLTTQEAAPLVQAYQHLAAATTAASLTYTALTGPSVTTAALEPQLPAPSLAADLHVGTSPADRAQPVAVTVAGQRWQDTLAAVDPRLLADPHYPVLAAALDRVELAGVNVTASLAAATATPLPDAHTARALHYQLIDVCPAAITPYTRTPDNTRAATQITSDLSNSISAARRTVPEPSRSGPPR